MYHFTCPGYIPGYPYPGYTPEVGVDLR